MFSRFFRELAAGQRPDLDQLGRMFDVAMTKKMAVLALPPQFWVSDAKINPRADHLLWAALLLEDRERLALAVTALAAEAEGHGRLRQAPDLDGLLTDQVRRLSVRLPGEAGPHQARFQALLKQVGS